jgi:outer membrane murein-binding lipoprotein Lpp
MSTDNKKNTRTLMQKFLICALCGITAVSLAGCSKTTPANELAEQLSQLGAAKEENKTAENSEEENQENTENTKEDEKEESKESASPYQVNSSGKKYDRTELASLYAAGPQTYYALQTGLIFPTAYDTTQYIQSVASPAAVTVSETYILQGDIFGKIADDQWIVIEENGNINWFQYDEEYLSQDRPVRYKSYRDTTVYTLPTSKSTAVGTIAAGELITGTTSYREKSYSPAHASYVQIAENQWADVHPESETLDENLNPVMPEARAQRQEFYDEYDAAVLKTTMTAFPIFPAAEKENYSGPACLQAVLAGMGIEVTQAELAEKLGTDSVGVSTIAAMRDVLNSYIADPNEQYQSLFAFVRAPYENPMDYLGTYLEYQKPVIMVVDKSMLGLGEGRTYAVAYGKDSKFKHDIITTAGVPFVAGPPEKIYLYVPGSTGENTAYTVSYETLYKAIPDELVDRTGKDWQTDDTGIIYPVKYKNFELIE